MKGTCSDSLTDVLNKKCLIPSITNCLQCDNGIG